MDTAGILRSIFRFVQRVFPSVRWHDLRFKLSTGAVATAQSQVLRQPTKGSCVMTRKLYILMLMMAGMFTLQACDTNEGPVEEAAEEVDDFADDVEDDIDDAID